MAKEKVKRRKKAGAGPFNHPAYTVRRKFFKFFGAAFYLLDEAGEVIGYSHQKAFKLKEDIRVYTDDSMTEELLVIKARNIIDFGATYDVTDPAEDDQSIGSYRRKGWTSLVRDEWMIFDADENDVGRIQEDSAGLAIVRRLFGNIANLIAPQAYNVEIDGAKAADMATSRNPFIYKLNVTIDPDADNVDARMILAGAILLAAIEGRQGGGGVDFG
ncbi:MAG: hypothetical protein HYX68_00845 [Planctomycetes bacterium]|jgi:hypothetical protein|nr:hypothetical protein [Planctomycetota bacterium]